MRTEYATHYREGNYPLCNELVSRARGLTDTFNDVTCRNCLRVLENRRRHEQHDYSPRPEEPDKVWPVLAKREHTCTRVMAARDDAEKRAWDALARYKFWMFGYWSAKWVTLNGLLAGDMQKRENPFASLVKAARERVA